MQASSPLLPCPHPSTPPQHPELCPFNPLHCLYCTPCFNPFPAFTTSYYNGTVKVRSVCLEDAVPPPAWLNFSFSQILKCSKVFKSSNFGQLNLLPRLFAEGNCTQNAQLLAVKGLVSVDHPLRMPLRQPSVSERLDSPSPS